MSFRYHSKGEEMASSKKLLWLSTGVALLGVFVASIATAAWFKVDSQPLQTSLVSSSPNITIDNDNIYGYKIKQNIGSNGFIDYSADTVAKIHGSQIAGTNIHQDDEDINFDVPSGGIGYYIIKQNPGGTYKYSYNSTSYSWKFTEYSGSSRSYTTSISLIAGDNLIVKKYTFEANKTVNKQVDINSTYGADSSTESNSVIIGTAGTYKAWFDSTNGTIGFEDVGTPISGKNLRSSPKVSRTNETKVANINKPTRASSTNTKSNIDTGTTFSKIGFQKTYDDGANADWYIHTWGSGGGTTWPGTKVGSNWNHSETSASNWVSAPSGYESHTGFIVVRMQPNTTNEWNRVESTISSSDPKNFFKVTGSGLNVTTERMSELNIYHKLGNNSPVLQKTIGVWNKNSVSSTMTDDGSYAPTKTYYTFNGWYKDSACTVAFTDGYITHDTNIYGKFTKNTPSASTFTTYLYDAAGTTASPTWSAPKLHAWANNYEAVDYNYSERYTHNGHYYYEFEVSVTFTGFMFQNGTSTGGTNQTIDLTKSDGNGKYFVMDTTDGGKRSGHWYGSLASEDTYTYYFYDNRSSGRWTAPYAYAWASSGVTNDANNYTIYPYQAVAWPGIAMTQATAKATADGIEPEYTWSITVSQSYNKIIFDKGVGANSNTAGDQTNDLTTTGHNGQYCILNGQTDGKWNVQWNNNIYGITLKASFFIGGAQSSLDYEDLGSENSVGLVNYTPKLSPATNITKADQTNGIVYYFSRVGTTWYTDPDCAAGHAYSAGPLTGSITLYAKYNVDVSGYKDIYIDTVNTGWGDSVYIFDGGGTQKYFGGYKVAPNLYRVTLPAQWNFRVSRNDHVTGDTNGTYWSTQITIDSYSTGTYGVVTANGDSNQNFSVKSLKTTSYGTAKIQKYNGSSWVDISGGTMEIGDGTSNYFVFEHGLQIAVNTKIRVVVTNGSPSSLTGTYNYSKYLIPDGTTTPYVVNDGGDIKTANYTGNARFNFYITAGATPKLTIAMVPDLGNGYYIMDYNSTYGTNNFISETKMSSSSKTRAVYDGYYATAGKQVFIKSYLDAVDVLYTTLSASSSAYASISNGVITITSAGYYSITVDNGTITISSYSIDDDFKLNKLDISKNTSKELIWKQKTSIVLEIPFTCDNKYASTISINPDFGNLSNFVGASLYVTDAAHKLADPYTTLRGSNSSTRSTYYNSLSNAATITDSNSFVIPANSGSTVFYAYILIDYLPTGTGVSYTNFTNSTYLAGQIWFYIKDTQQ